MRLQDRSRLCLGGLGCAFRGSHDASQARARYSGVQHTHASVRVVAHSPDGGGEGAIIKGLGADGSERAGELPSRDVVHKIHGA